MKWTIEGADKRTGKEKVLSVEALDEAEARAEAGKLGLLISEVHESITERTAPTTRRAAPMRIEHTAPQYAGLVLCATALRVFGVVVLLADLAVGVVTLSRAPETGAVDATGQMLVYAAGVATWGLILFAIGDALSALRDLARNSFTR